MTARVHLHNCGECGAETTNHSLICDACAPGYNTQAVLSDLARAKVAFQARAIEKIIKKGP